MLSSGMKMLSSGANGIIWDYMLSSGLKRYHLEPMLSSGTTFYHLVWNVIIWDAMLSCGANVIIWDKMLSSEANVIMVSSGANVIIWCYHVMLSSGMITPPFFVFPGNFTHSKNIGSSIQRQRISGRPTVARWPWWRPNNSKLIRTCHENAEGRPWSFN